MNDNEAGTYIDIDPVVPFQYKEVEWHYSTGQENQWETFKRNNNE